MQGTTIRNLHSIIRRGNLRPINEGNIYNKRHRELLCNFIGFYGKALYEIRR